jgi:hypothetical protein
VFVRGDVELERMNEFVADDVVGVAERAAHREDDPPAQRFGDAACSLAQLSLDGVGLLEVDV